ncbi:MAG: cytochrome P450 [Chloroflexi bacterium]|nr:cytochrome P450 [Chloroflexota bacterium]
MMMFLSPEMLRNRYQIYAQMRSMQPVMHLEDYGLWLAFGYDDVKYILSDYTNFSSDYSRMETTGGNTAQAEMQQNAGGNLGTSLISTDPPRHRQLRDLVSRAFSPRAVANLESRIVKLTHQMLDTVIAQGEIDLIGDLAYPLPVVVISEMLGVPPEDRDQFKRWSDLVVASADSFLPGDTMSAADLAAQGEANQQMQAYFRRILQERRAAPQDDLVSGLIAAEIAAISEIASISGSRQKLSEDDIQAFCMLLLVAGNVTTTNLIGNSVLALLEHPDQFARLRANPDLWPAAIEEVLRYQSPVQAMFRIAARDSELAGQKVRAGDRMLAWIGSANRDEKKFPEADHFDIGRDPNPHIAFGFGIHYCLGAPLARLEARVVLPIIFGRLAGLERKDHEPLDITKGIILHGVTSLPLVFAPGEPVVS